MKLFINNLILKGDSEVYDENENIIYKVNGKRFTLTKEKTIVDSSNNPLFIVRNKSFSRSVYIYDDKMNEVAKLSKEISLSTLYEFKEYKDEYSIQGKVFSSKY